MKEPLEAWEYDPAWKSLRFLDITLSSGNLYKSTLTETGWIKM
jgi:hypothetical protein